MLRMVKMVRSGWSTGSLGQGGPDDNIQKIYGLHRKIIEKRGEVTPVSMCHCRNHDPCHYQQKYHIFWHVHCSTPR